MRYTYGTGDIAKRRLLTISGVFNPHSAAFVSKHATAEVGCAVDIGCGPGFSTVMLAESSKAIRTCGIDSSHAFLSSAQTLPHCDFFLHDVTSGPLPVKADLMYCRFLLSHLRDPVELIGKWIDELQPGGKLLIEEIEEIETGVEVFQRYLEMNAGLVASQGASLFIGGELAAAEYNHTLITNEADTLPVSEASVAAMFYPNTISIWEQEDYILDRLSSRERREIAESMHAIMDSGSDRTGALWTMRRMAFLKAC